MGLFVLFRWHLGFLTTGGAFSPLHAPSLTYTSTSSPLLWFSEAGFDHDDHDARYDDHAPRDPNRVPGDQDRAPKGSRDQIVGAGKTVYYTHFEEEIFSQEATIQFLLNANPDMPPPSNLPPKKEGGGSAAPALKRGRSKVQGSGKGKGKGSAAAEARGAGGGGARTFACLVLGTGAYRRALPQIQRLVAGTIS
uniref:Uncharacterized protein n=1 Tax=Heterosigma akashiwo TaxID=2829 RepID=A0A7S3Y825_HETAK